MRYLFALLFVAFFISVTQPMRPTQDELRWRAIRNKMNVGITPTHNYWYCRDPRLPSRDDGQTFEQAVDELIGTTR